MTALSLFIRELCPEAQFDVSFAHYEDADAHIWISPPLRLDPEVQEELANRIAGKVAMSACRKV